MFCLRKIYILYKYEQFLKPICPFRSKTWAGRSPELAGMNFEPCTLGFALGGTVFNRQIIGKRRGAVQGAMYRYKLPVAAIEMGRPIFWAPGALGSRLRVYITMFPNGSPPT